MKLLIFIWFGFLMWGMLTIDSILWLGGYIAMMLMVLALLQNLYEATEINDENMNL